MPVNAVGTNAPGTVKELDVEGWDHTFYVNTRVPFCCPRPFPRLWDTGAARSSTSPLWQARRAGPTPRPTAPPSWGSQALRKLSPTMYACN